MSENGFPSPGQRLYLIVADPGRAFHGLAESRWAWVLPVLIVSLLMVAPPQLMPELYLERQEQALDRMIDGGLLNEEQAFEARQRFEESGERSAGTIATQMSLGVVMQFILRYILTAAILLAGLRFVMEGGARFATVLNVVAFSSVPAALREIIRTPLMLSEGSLDIYFSPAALTGTSTLSGYTLSLIDLFDLWILALLILGLASIGNISRGRAAGLVIPLWIVFCLLKIGIKATPFGAGL